MHHIHVQYVRGLSIKPPVPGDGCAAWLRRNGVFLLGVQHKDILTIKNRHCKAIYKAIIGITI